MAHAIYEAKEKQAEAEAAAKQWRYLWFGIYLTSVDSERLQIQSEQDTDLSASENLIASDHILDYTKYGKSGPATYSRLTYSPNADGNYRLVVNLGIIMYGFPVIWEFIIDQMGNCTRKRI